MYFDINGLFIVTWTRINSSNERRMADEDGKIVAREERTAELTNLIL